VERALPLRFERNDGQLDARVRYVARSEGMTLALEDAGPALVLRRAGAAVRMRVEGAWPRADLVADGRLETLSNYFVGNDPGAWRTNVPNDAAGLLGVLGDPVAIDPLARSLRIESYRLRTIALEALARFGPAAASAVPSIEALTGNWATSSSWRTASAPSSLPHRGGPSAGTAARAPSTIHPGRSSCSDWTGRVSSSRFTSPRRPGRPDAFGEGGVASVDRVA
jgi:hypothetical protein